MTTTASKPRIRVSQENVYSFNGEYEYTYFHAYWNGQVGTVSAFDCHAKPAKPRVESWTDGFFTVLAFSGDELALAWQQHLHSMCIGKSSFIKDKGKNHIPGSVVELQLRGLSLEDVAFLMSVDLTELPDSDLESDLVETVESVEVELATYNGKISVGDCVAINKGEFAYVYSVEKDGCWVSNWSDPDKRKADRFIKTEDIRENISEIKCYVEAEEIKSEVKPGDTVRRIKDGKELTVKVVNDDGSLLAKHNVLVAAGEYVVVEPGTLSEQIKDSDLGKLPAPASELTMLKLFDYNKSPFHNADLVQLKSGEQAHYIRLDNFGDAVVNMATDTFFNVPIDELTLLKPSPIDRHLHDLVQPKFELIGQYTEFASLIGHPALSQGELLDPTQGYEFVGADERGLPTIIQSDDEGDELEQYSLTDEAEAVKKVKSVNYFLEPFPSIDFPTPEPINNTRFNIGDRVYNFVNGAGRVISIDGDVVKCEWESTKIKSCVVAECLEILEAPVKAVVEETLALKVSDSEALLRSADRVKHIELKVGDRVKHIEYKLQGIVTRILFGETYVRWDGVEPPRDTPYKSEFIVLAKQEVETPNVEDDLLPIEKNYGKVETWGDGSPLADLIPGNKPNQPYSVGEVVKVLNVGRLKIDPVPETTTILDITQIGKDYYLYKVDIKNSAGLTVSLTADQIARYEVVDAVENKPAVAVMPVEQKQSATDTKSGLIIGATVEVNSERKKIIWELGTILNVSTVGDETSYVVSVGGNTHFLWADELDLISLPKPAPKKPEPEGQLTLDLSIPF